MDLGASDSASILHGRAVRVATGLAPGTPVRAYDSGGALLGMLEVTAGDRLQVVRLMTSAAP